MKMNAIISNGQRSKDFVDLYFLLDFNLCSVADILLFYQEKYSQKNNMILLKSLVYFADVDLQDWPFLLMQQGLSWEQVKKTIEKAVLDYIAEK